MHLCYEDQSLDDAEPREWCLLWHKQTYHIKKYSCVKAKIGCKSYVQ